MASLYDLLGALPDDDAENLRAAFRKAVKGAHPDINPGDPDAALKFRKIAYANQILSDEEQRAAYDYLLDLAHLEQKTASKRARAATIYRLATGVMVLAFFSIVSLGGYLLFEYVNTAPLGPAQTTDVSRAEPAKTAALVTEKADTVRPTRDKLEDVDGPKKLGENLEDLKEATRRAIATSEVTGSVSADAAWVRDFGTNDAKYYRERGALAYRRGELHIALVDFGLAIQLDPSLSDAHIDRAIVFHRMGDLERAFADVAQAKRIDDSNRSKASLTASAP